MTSVSTDRRLGINSGSAVKVPARVATTANIALSGEKTIDGVACVTGDRVLVKNQTAGSENGIYIVDTGAWTRAPDWDGSYDVVRGTMVYITSGTVSAGLFYIVTTADPITIGTTSVALALVTPQGVVLPLAVTEGGTGGQSAISGLSNLGLIQITGEGGTANVQTGTIDALVTALRPDQLFLYVPAVTNTAAATLTLTPAGGGSFLAKNVRANGAALVGGELVAGVPVLLHYDGFFSIIGQTRVGAMLASAASPGLLNGYLDWTVAANALTVAIKTLAGADPSADDPVYAVIRSATATIGLPTVAKITAATSLVVSSGSTLGTRNAIPARVWAVLFDDAGTYRLGVINCLTTVAGAGAGSDVTAIYPLAGWGIASSTAEGGAGAADSAQTFYTGAAVASKPYGVLGYATFETGQAAAGTWATAATRKQLWGPGVPLPGQVIQTQHTDTGALSTTATVIPWDDTIPQNTEGAQFMSASITPTSAANALHLRSVVCISSDSNRCVAAVFQDAVANALRAAFSNHGGAFLPYQLELDMIQLAAATAATTFKIRGGQTNAGTATFNGDGGARLMGGVANSFVDVVELMA